MNDSSWAAVSVCMMLTGLWVLPGCCCANPPKGRITAASKTPACSAELQATLEQFKTKGGYAFSIESSDAQALFDTGRLEKCYARDGMNSCLSFGLSPSEKRQGCALNLYMSEQRRLPSGSTTTTYPGMKIELSSCECEFPD